MEWQFWAIVIVYRLFVKKLPQFKDVVVAETHFLVIFLQLILQ